MGKGLTSEVHFVDKKNEQTNKINSNIHNHTETLRVLYTPVVNSSFIRDLSLGVFEKKKCPFYCVSILDSYCDILQHF